jgi:hypothetical protein
VPALRLRLVASLGAFAIALPLALAAQTAQPAPQPSDPAPDRAARLSYLDGSVSVLPTGAQEWSKGFLNRPLTSGDQLWSDTSSRAELELGGVVVRVSGNSEISVLDYSAQGLQLGVGVGTVDVALHDASSNQSFEVDTPEVAITLQRDGDYRVNVDLDGTTTVLVRSGSTHLSAKSGEGISLRDGQGVVFATDGSLDVADARTADNFDRWCAQRDAQWQHDNSQASYVADDVPGAEQLNDAGQWNNQPDYGDVWFPNQVSAGWAPYQNGRWAWVRPWGWTWIDKAPWGFAPYHYGRWININGRWGWLPPPLHAHPNFSASLIAAPASVTSSAPAPERPAHMNALPPTITRRPVVATRAPSSAQLGPFQHVVLAAPAPRAQISEAPIPSLIGPTIYARSVQVEQHAPPTDIALTHNSVVRAPPATTTLRLSSLAGRPATPAAMAPNFTRVPRATVPVPTAAPKPPPSHASAPPKPAMRTPN